MFLFLCGKIAIKLINNVPPITYWWHTTYIWDRNEVIKYMKYIFREIERKPGFSAIFWGWKVLESLSGMAVWISASDNKSY